VNQAKAVGAVPGVTSRAEALLTCGVLAGPLFIAVSFAHASARSGFDFARHPLSLLTLGDLGWLQILTFVVAGVLFVASAFGMRQILDRDNGGTWAPRLIALFGFGLTAGGVYASADKAFVRRLKRRLEEEGYETLLDEKDLLVGDPLATKIFEAIHTARVVIVVVSEASVASNWLKHEVNAAARRMVEGRCRLIPVLIGNVEPPAEVEPSSLS
jgi:hypothetical protein